MSSIRLRYAGYVAFAAQILSVFTGLLFTTMIARRLSPAEYGVWQLIYAFAWYFAFPSIVVRYWVIRYESRKIRTGRTGLLLNLVLSAILISLYIGSSVLVSSATGVEFPYLLAAGGMIFLIYILDPLIGLSRAIKPQTHFYAYIVFHVSRVLVGALLIVFLRMGLGGTIASVILAYIVYDCFLLLSFREHLGGRFNRKLASRIVRNSWVPLYDSMAKTALTLDSVLIPLAVGSTLPLAFYKASFTIATVVGYTEFLAVALYPKLLGGGGKADIEEALEMVLRFGIPMWVGIVLLAKPLLSLLNPVYVDVWPVVWFIASASLLRTISRVYNMILKGTETVELKEDVSFRDIVKSRLFLSPSLLYVNAGLHLTLLTAIAYVGSLLGMDNSTLTVLWGVSWFVAVLPLAAGRWWFARPLSDARFPWRKTLIFVLSSSVMAVVVILLRDPSIHIQFYSALASIAPAVAAGAVTYFAILYPLDAEFRRLIRIVFEMVRGLSTRERRKRK